VLSRFTRERPTSRSHDYSWTRAFERSINRAKFPGGRKRPASMPNGRQVRSAKYRLKLEPTAKSKRSSRMTWPFWFL